MILHRPFYLVKVLKNIRTCQGKVFHEEPDQHQEPQKNSLSVLQNKGFSLDEQPIITYKRLALDYYLNIEFFYVNYNIQDYHWLPKTA